MRPVVGLRAWGATWGGDMLGLQFGDEREVTSQFGARKGQVKTVGEWALHIQHWEIAGWGVRINNDSPAEQRASAGEALGDAREVERVSADASGGLRLTLTGSFLVTALPRAGVAWWAEGEYWRLMRPGDTSRHFVVTDQGISD